MAFVLPGLGLANQDSSSNPYQQASSNASQPTRTETLEPQTEWRFEVAFGQRYTVRLTSGNAEHWGVELASNREYVFTGAKSAIFTWQGCTLEITGVAESEYAGRETDYMVEWLNVHGMLESAREEATKTSGGPRVLVVGPDHVGKSSLVRCLAAWAVRLGRTPTLLNLDPREGVLAPPGSFSAVTLGGQMDVETGYGTPPISGPTAMPVKTPLVYSWPYPSPSDRPEAFKSLLTTAALHVTGKVEADATAKRSGFIIDTPGTLNDPKTSYEALSHIVSEFSITCILTMGSERLFNDINRRWNVDRGDEKGIPVLRLTKPGGAIERDPSFMKALRAQQVRTYFFGPGQMPLNPNSHSIAFADMQIYRAKRVAASADDEHNFQAGGMDDDDYEPDAPWSASASSSYQNGGGSSAFEKVTPSTALMASLLAIKFCPSNTADETRLRDSSVMGYLYVSEVDEARKRVRVLAPHPQRWGDRALVLGGFPEVVPDLVT